MLAVLVLMCCHFVLLFSVRKMIYYKDEHNSLEVVPTMSGFYLCIIKYYSLVITAVSSLLFLCRLFGDIPRSLLSVTHFSPNFSSGNSKDQGRIFLHIAACDNLQFSSSLIQKEMQNKPITKFLPYLKISHFTRTEGSNIHKNWLGDFERIFRLPVDRLSHCRTVKTTQFYNLQITALWGSKHFYAWDLYVFNTEYIQSVF